MNFNYRLDETFPILAWSAVIKPGSDEIQVQHGAGVETTKSWFIEGAWNGAFRRGDFDQSETMTGNGARLRDGRAVFVPPTDMFCWLVSLRTPDSLIVSNSMVLALTQAGDRPDLEYPDYWFDVVHSRRLGLRHRSTPMPTARGNTLDIHQWRPFTVTDSLEILPLARPMARPFTDFEAYRGLLNTRVKAVVENAGDPARKSTFRPLAAISQGYDSAACAVPMAEAGCTEAICFSRQPRVPGGPDDSGHEIAACLGMQATTDPIEEYVGADVLSEAEFCAVPGSGTSSPVAIAGDQFAGSLLSCGRPGEDVWGLEEIYNIPDLMSPASWTTNTTQMLEFRLRRGFQVFCIPYIGAIHREALQSISLSAEMKPWWLDQKYNRPIARRLLEQSGVPREAFGQVKMATNARRDIPVAAAPAADFAQWLRGQDLPGPYGSGRYPARDFLSLPVDILYYVSKKWPGRRKRLHRWLLPLTLKSYRRIGLRQPPRDLFRFHWAFDRVSPRYQSAAPGA